MSIALSTTQSKALGKGLTAQVIRASGLKEQRLTLYHRAVTSLEARQQWPAGHLETLSEGQLQGRQGKVYLINEGGLIALCVFRQGATMKDNMIRRFPMAILAGNGWERLADSDEDDYIRWHSEVQKAIKNQR